MSKVDRGQIICPLLDKALDQAVESALGGLPGIPYDWRTPPKYNSYNLTTKGSSRGEAVCGGTSKKRISVTYNFKKVEWAMDSEGMPVNVYNSEDYTESIDIGGTPCTQVVNQK